MPENRALPFFISVPSFLLLLVSEAQKVRRPIGNLNHRPTPSLQQTSQNRSEFVAHADEGILVKAVSNFHPSQES